MELSTQKFVLTGENSFGKEAIKEMGDVKKMAGEIDSNESQNLVSDFKKHSKPTNNRDL